MKRKQPITSVDIQLDRAYGQLARAARKVQDLQAQQQAERQKQREARAVPA